MNPYTAQNIEGPDTAAIGKWRIDGPGIIPFLIKDRTLAKVVASALNKAYQQGKSHTAA